MDGQEVAIRELNAFLKGRYMGIKQLENLIQNTQDEAIKEQLQEIQQIHKNQATRLAERIQNLGGRPVDGIGIKGTLQEWMGRLKGYPQDKRGIIELAKKGEDFYSLEISEEIVRGDLDPESRALIEEILDEDRLIVTRLERLLDQIENDRENS